MKKEVKIFQSISDKKIDFPMVFNMKSMDDEEIIELIFDYLVIEAQLHWFYSDKELNEIAKEILNKGAWSDGKTEYKLIDSFIYQK